MLRILQLFLSAMLLLLATSCGIEEPEYVGKITLNVQRAAIPPRSLFLELRAEDPGKLKGITCQETGNLGELELSAIRNSPELAERAVQEAAQHLIDFGMAKERERSAFIMELLERDAEIQEAKLDAARQKMLESMKKSGVTDPQGSPE